jgi:Tfp pilus assembly protein PilF
VARNLWKRALAMNSALDAPGLDLARIEWQLGRHSEAKQAVSQVLSLNPDSAQALSLLRQMN